MQIFIFERVEELTGNYHPEGGLAVIAKNLEDCIKFANSEKQINLSEQEISDVKVFSLSDKNIENQIFIFPDSGCC